MRGAIEWPGADRRDEALFRGEIGGVRLHPARGPWEMTRGFRQVVDLHFPNDMAIRLGWRRENRNVHYYSNHRIVSLQSRQKAALPPVVHYFLPFKWPCSEGSKLFAFGSSSSIPKSFHQSSPNISMGCCVLPLPFPQPRLFAGQYLSQPQQIRSGKAGLIGNCFAKTNTHSDSGMLSVFRVRCQPSLRAHGGNRHCNAHPCAMRSAPAMRPGGART